MRTPIARLVKYALSEPYDYYILDHNRQHAHWYLEAGLRNIVCIPALLLADEFRVPTADTREEIIFIGQTGSFHPRRSRLLKSIDAAGLPLTIDSVPHSMAIDRYNQNRITLNCSLNGDLNLRVFETMAAGGMLMTDRLAPESGLYSLFTEGEHFVEYSGEEELISKARYYLQNPAQRDQIANNGYRRISSIMNMQARIRTLTNLIEKNRVEQRFRIDSDGRIAAYGCHSGEDLRYRIALYEWVQEQHRKFDGIRVFTSAGGDIRMLCDLADLPHLQLFCAESHSNQNLLNSAGLEARVTMVSAEGQLPGGEGKTIAICSVADYENCLRSFNPDALLFADKLELMDTELEMLTAQLKTSGYETGKRFAGVAHYAGSWQ
jgi:hypothetical protein